MKLLTVEQIIQALQKDGIAITRAKFNYYSKIRLLFAPEKRTKKRVKQGIISFYAEEILERLKTIYELKDLEYTLGEIESYLQKKDKDHLVKLYGEAGVSLEPIRESEITISFEPVDEAGVKTKNWMSEGYYSGLQDIYLDIIDKLESSKSDLRSRRDALDLLRDKILREIKCSDDKILVEKRFKNEFSSLLKRIRDKNKSLMKIRCQHGDLREFLIGEVYGPASQEDFKNIQF